MSLSKEDAALLAKLPPDMAALLYPEHTAGPLTVTLVYPELDEPARSKATELEGTAAEHGVDEPTMSGGAAQHRTTFTMRQVEQLHHNCTTCSRRRSE
jgi:hypothetical protein